MTTDTIKGRVIVVTGASRGIGKGLATYLAREGATVVCAARTVAGTTGRVPRDDRRDRRPRSVGEGGNAVAVRCDIGAADDIAALVAATVERVRPPRRAREQRDDADACAAGRVDGRDVGRLDARQRAQPLSLHASRDAGDARAAAGSIINISSGAAAHEVERAHAARIRDLFRGEGGAGALLLRGRARAAPARHQHQRAAAGRGADRAHRAGVRRRLRLVGLGGTGRRRPAGRVPRRSDRHRFHRARCSTSPASAGPGASDGGATNGHGVSRSTASATSKSSSSAWWRASTCMPTGSPSTNPPGIDTAGLP